MNTLLLAGSLLAIVTYFPLWKQIWCGEAKQNFFTWILWGVLDGLGAVAIVFQNGSYLLPVAYTIGSLITVLLILKSGEKPKLTWFEIMVFTLILLCMVVWYFSGSKVAIIAGSVAAFIATFPQFVDAWKKPDDMPFVVYLSYFVANCLSIAGGKCWSVEERLFPASGAFLCFIIVVLSARRFLPKRAE